MRRATAAAAAILAAALVAPGAAAAQPAPPAPPAADGVSTTLPPVQIMAEDRDANTAVNISGPTGGGASQLAATATFQVTYTGFSAEAQAAFQKGVDLWSTLVTSSVPIKIAAEFKALGTGILGSAGSTSSWRDFAGAPQSGTFYPVALAEALRGSDLNSGAADISASFNSNFSNWYFGLDGQTPSGNYDFVSTVMHEIGHGLGFAGSATVSGSTGSWGFGASGGPVFPTIYDRFTQDLGGTAIINTSTYPNPSSALGTVLRSDNVYASGSKTNVPDAGRPKLYAPATWQGGSSYSHLDEARYEAGTINSLMTPAAATAEANHGPGPIALCLFEDMGWVTPESCAPPANDGFGAPQVLGSRSGTATGTNVGATKQAGEPDHAGNAGGPSVWYSWTPPSDGTATFDTVGSGSGTRVALDTLLAVYTGSAVSALTPVAANDDRAPGDPASQVGPIPVTGGTTYRIAVDGYRLPGKPASTGSVKLNWSLAGTGAPVADFDGDGDTDVSVFRPTSGGWFSASGLATTYGAAGDVAIPADYDGDGRTDTAVFRPSTGLWSIRHSSTGTDSVLTYGVGSDVPTPGDFDGDGRADVAVFRPSLSTWYVRNSATNTDTIVTFGLSGDIPVIGDYDGDGRADIALFRRSAGSWFVQRSSGGSTTSSWGASGDIPVPGDYDGDGRSDLAVARPSSGTWFVQRSSDGATTMVTYGVGSDRVQPGDYDGDGRTDVGVVRPSLSTWFTRNTSNGADVVTTFGLGSDLALPLADAIRRFVY